jgi:CRISPR-associated Csx2 family protein
MRKAFISILGTNDYLECFHSYGGIVTEKPVKYCQEDMIKIFCKDFDEESEIRVFLTKDAENINWLDNGHIDRATNQPIQNRGLKTRLEELKLKSPIIVRSIKEGFTEEEIWEIFQVIFNSLREDEEVIVDITHSFRSLPMLMIVLLNYAKQVKNIKVSGIYYAAFETLGSIKEVSKKPVEERIVPILNLTLFSELQSWTNATYDFINNANIEGLNKLLKASIRNSNTVSVQEKFFPTNVTRSLNNFINNIALCRGKALIEFDYETLKNNIDKLKTSELPTAFNNLIEIVKNKISLFNKDPKKLMLAIADWCLKHNLYQQASTLLQEFTITIILLEMNLNYTDEKNRVLCSQVFRIQSQNIPEQEWIEPASVNKQLVKDIMNLELLQNISPLFNSLTALRNDVNHSGFLNNARSSDSIRDRLKTIVDEYKNIFNYYYAPKPLESPQQ